MGNGKKIFFVSLGLFATSLALLGVWLPGTPTAFPLIVALWAFSKSSEKMHAWVSRLPVLKQALKEAERFERERSIDWRIKMIAMGGAWISTIAVIVLTRNLLLGALVASSALACTGFMMYVPTRRAHASEPAAEEKNA